MPINLNTTCQTYKLFLATPLIFVLSMADFHIKLAHATQSILQHGKSSLALKPCLSNFIKHVIFS